ncbi:Retrovirus-related Pol polyprotein from transposon 17.6 [Araneus ventricosus]|uniref:Retrovirus-related Pol polyprotein from transposon 17.6 n=1 Tax=Araneus ventricosus TaxID=182803 RepID=A0A4Y2LC16_ARAVE|nr:Retrovirus-related Pol polyprotein from transposon 17.6 [Araneus ventricosus]
MPFGLLNAPFCFSKFMATLLQGCEKYCVPYLDDVAIFSDTWETHMEHLDKILEKIAGAKLKIKPIKCKFAQDSVKYLGHKVGGGCRTPAEAKIQAVLDFPAPRSKTEIRKILGMIAYYSRYIENYATLVEPLTRALKGKTRKESITWTSEMEEALITVKQRLTEKPVLYAPNFEKEFIVQTDASDLGIGVVLAQRTKGEEHPILYLSRKFSGPEKNYSTTEKECAAIIFAIKKLRYYLDGQKFIIETDHNPLVWLKTNAGNNPRLMRWALALQPFNYTIVQKPGKNIAHADCLSRM